MLFGCLGERRGRGSHMELTGTLGTNTTDTTGALVPRGTSTLEGEERGLRTQSRGICGNVKDACLSMNGE